MRNGVWTMAVVVVAAAGAAIPRGADAQVELGFDAGFLRTMVDQPSGDVTASQVTTSTGMVRLGVPVGDRLVLESLLAFNRTSVDDNSGWSTALRPGLTVLLGDGRGARPYVRVGVGLETSDSNQSESTTQWAAGGGVGLRLPTDGGPFFRLEAGFDRVFETDERLARTQLQLLVGFSAPVG